MNLWFSCQEGSLYRLTLLTKKGALISPMLHERVCVSTVRYLGPHLKHPASVAAHLCSCLRSNERVPSKVRHRTGYLCVLQLTTLPLLQTVQPNHMMTVNDVEMMMMIIIIIIIFIDCNWVVIRWQWLFYMYTKYEIGF